MTIGEKIKTARTLFKLTQKELGLMTDLSDARIRQYELGIRTPKEEQLLAISSALNIPIEFFKERHITSDLEIMQALFEIDDTHGIRIHPIADEDSNITEYAISFNSISLNNYIAAWKKAKDNLNVNDSNSIQKYNEWKVTFPNDTVNEMSKKLRTKRKELSEE